MLQQHKLNTSIVLVFFIGIILCSSCKHSRTETVLPSTENVDWADSAYQLNAIANELYNNGQVDSLEVFVPKAMKTCLEHGQMERYYTIWRVLVEKLIWIDQYDKAMAMAMKMEGDAIKRHEDHGLFEAYSLLGLGYAYRGNVDESVKFFQKAISIFHSKNVAPLMETYNYLTQVQTDSSQLENLPSTLEEWKKHIDENHYSKSKATIEKWAQWNYQYQRSMTDYLVTTGQLKAAMAALDSSEHYLKLEGNPIIDRLQLLYTRSSLELTRHDYTAALEHSQKMLDLASNRVDNSHKINALTMKVEALERLGRYKEALEWQHKLKNFKDSLTTADNMKELNMLNKHFEVNELKMEAERNRLRAKTQQLFLIIVIAIVALIALVVFIILRHRTTAKLAKAHNELQKAYEQLEIANSKAEESLRMKNNFIHQISHEINTPLSILSGFSQIITMPNIKLSTEEREKLYKDLVENTNRISGLVNRVIDLSEANSKVAIERCDKVEAILIAMDAIESSGISQATHLEFSQQIPDEIGNIVLTTNQKAATRALIQILDNAYKFTTPTGSKKAYQDQPEIAEKKRARLTVTRNNTHIVFTVEDNGIVIPPEEAEHIFEEFVQLNIFYEGTGVGLTIARSLARKLGGDITLDTNYISGARFIMSLPLK